MSARCRASHRAGSTSIEQSWQLLPPQLRRSPRSSCSVAIAGLWGACVWLLSGSPQARSPPPSCTARSLQQRRRSSVSPTRSSVCACTGAAGSRSERYLHSGRVRRTCSRVDFYAGHGALVLAAVRRVPAPRARRLPARPLAPCGLRGVERARPRRPRACAESAAQPPTQALALGARADRGERGAVSSRR